MNDGEFVGGSYGGKDYLVANTVLTKIIYFVGLELHFLIAKIAGMNFFGHRKVKTFL